MYFREYMERLNETEINKVADYLREQKISDDIESILLEDDEMMMISRLKKLRRAL